MLSYARVSTHDQTLALQQDALKQAGGAIFTDTASGAADRPGLDQAAGFLGNGTLVAWKLDRLGRSLPPYRDDHRLQERGPDRADRHHQRRKPIFHVFAALAEFERDGIGTYPG
jgi:DNA invertase Pin-like site-specific DNA recombinase